MGCEIAHRFWPSISDHGSSQCIPLWSQRYLLHQERILAFHTIYGASSGTHRIVLQQNCLDVRMSRLRHSISDTYATEPYIRYNPVIRDDFTKSILSPIYGSMGNIALDIIHPHRLSVFFIVMGSGTLYDSSPSAKMIAQQFQALARAAFSLEPIMEECTSATVQALFLIVRFIYVAHRLNTEIRWLLNGLVGRLSQIVRLLCIA